MAPSARTASVVVVSALAALALYASFSQEQGTVPEYVEISATYDAGLATISYVDRTGLGTVTMEILGMPETFQRTYNASFTETVPFASAPRHGWAVHPIVLDIAHPEHGDVRLKTEIRPAGEPAAPVIVSP